MIHVSGTSENLSTTIGNNVVIESGAIIHGCILEDNTYVGSGSQVLDGAVVKKNSMISPGSLLGQGKIVPSGQLWAGIPAKYVRDLTEAERMAIQSTCEENYLLAEVHAQETAKTWEMIEQDEFEYEQTISRNPDYYQRLSPKVYSIIVYIQIICLIQYEFFDRKYLIN